MHCLYTYNSPVCFQIFVLFFHFHFGEFEIAFSAVCDFLSAHIAYKLLGFSNIYVLYDFLSTHIAYNRNRFSTIYNGSMFPSILFVHDWCRFPVLINQIFWCFASNVTVVAVTAIHNFRIIIFIHLCCESLTQTHI